MLDFCNTTNNACTDSRRMDQGQGFLCRYTNDMTSDVYTALTTTSRDAISDSLLRFHTYSALGASHCTGTIVVKLSIYTDILPELAGLLGFTCQRSASGARPFPFQGRGVRIWGRVELDHPSCQHSLVHCSRLSSAIGHNGVFILIRSMRSVSKLTRDSRPHELPRAARSAAQPTSQTSV